MNRVLIAEDEPHLARVLRLGLEKAGYSVAAVSDGERALERIREDPPDVLITDIEMPRMNGEELCKCLGELVADPNFLVIVVTSHPEEAYRTWSNEIPDLQFLEKPVSLRKLYKMLDAHFSGLENGDGNG